MKDERAGEQANEQVRQANANEFTAKKNTNERISIASQRASDVPKACRVYLCGRATAVLVDAGGAYVFDLLLAVGSSVSFAMWFVFFDYASFCHCLLSSICVSSTTALMFVFVVAIFVDLSCLISSVRFVLFGFSVIAVSVPLVHHAFSPPP